MPARLTLVLVVIGVVLRLWAYAGVTPLWLDEILLGRNIIELPLGTLLTEPLRLDQVAPRGFLLVEKLAVSVFGPTELALRLFPFLCGLASLLLFWRLAARILEGWGVSIAVGLFALGVPFIKYSAEAKQYGVDVLAAIALLDLTLRLRDDEGPARARLLLGGASSFIVIWFSQTSVLVMTGIGLATAIEWLIARDRPSWRMLVYTLPVWALASAVAAVEGTRGMSLTTRAFMQDFWHVGFMPWPVYAPTNLWWLWHRAVDLFANPWLLRYPLPAVFVLIALIGLASLWRRRRFLALLVTAPLIVTVATAAAHQYPLLGRVTLFVMPGVILATAAGIEWLRLRVGRLQPALGLAVASVILAAPARAIVTALPPYDLEHHWSFLEHLQRNRQPGDVIYMFPLTTIGTAFYGPRFGLQPDEWQTSVCDQFDTRAYLRDVDRFRGSARVWVLLSGARPFRTARAGIQQYLATIGVRTATVARPSVAFGTMSLDLFDLSDPVRLAAATAESFPVDPMPTDPRPGCRPWTRPEGAGPLR